MIWLLLHVVEYDIPLANVHSLQLILLELSNLLTNSLLPLPSPPIAIKDSMQQYFFSTHLPTSRHARPIEVKIYCLLLDVELSTSLVSVPLEDGYQYSRTRSECRSKSAAVLRISLGFLNVNQVSMSQSKWLPKRSGIKSFCTLLTVQFLSGFRDDKIVEGGCIFSGRLSMLILLSSWVWRLVLNSVILV